MPARSNPLRMSEADLQTSVIELAQTLGWRVAHFRPARTDRGWRTPVQGDGKGFPDLVMVRRSRLIVAELKADRGRVSDDQALWLDTFRSVPGVEVYEWRPMHWPQIESVLAGGRRC